MTLIAAASTRLASTLNRQKSLDGLPFDVTGETHTLTGRWRMAHYGVMIPGLPDPFGFFNGIVILGSPRVPIFNNDPLLATAPDDAVWILTGTRALADGFRHYSAAADCEVGRDDASLGFADHLRLARSSRTVAVRAALDDLSVDLELELTPAVSHFAHIPGTYDHWSVLARYSGTIASGSEKQAVRGLCTYEYARAMAIPVPFARYFTYQIVNVDASTQVLMVEIIGTGGLVIQRMVYVRTTDGHASRHVRGFRHEVHQYASEPLRTPDGFAMRMPASFTWSVQDDDGSELITVHGTTNGDFRYGLGAGYAGSYAYTGAFRGSAISGTAYQEWIDRR